MTYTFQWSLLLSLLFACCKPGDDAQQPSAECIETADCPTGKQCEDYRCVDKQPDLQNSCTMNGLGSGTCRFTNLGTAPNALCGRIVVIRTERPMPLPQYPRTAESERFALQASGIIASEIFCSGQVQPKETKPVDFAVPLSGLCDGPRSYTWSDICSFAFLDDESTRLALKEGAEKLKRQLSEHHSRICAARDACIKSGQCAAKPYSTLMPTSDVECLADDAGCAASRLCKENGKCTARDGVCIAVSEKD